MASSGSDGCQRWAGVTSTATSNSGKSGEAGTGTQLSDGGTIEEPLHNKLSTICSSLSH